MNLEVSLITHYGASRLSAHLSLRHDRYQNWMISFENCQFF
jgi:hypothetical protein